MHHAHKKATKALESVLRGKKRARGDVPHKEEHPHQRARSQASDNIPETTDIADDEDEDGPSYGAAINQVNRIYALTRCRITSTSS